MILKIPQQLVQTSYGPGIFWVCMLFYQMTAYMAADLTLQL